MFPQLLSRGFNGTSFNATGISPNSTISNGTLSNGNFTAPKVPPAPPAPLVYHNPPLHPPAPPYPPTSAALGGVPSIHTDVPIATVFLVLFIGAAIGHMLIFKTNMARGHKFIPSAMLFGYCMARIFSMILRIAWACYPRNVRLAIAASIFMAAGILIIYIINVVFAQRLLRSRHPNLGWSRALSRCFTLLYVLLPITLIMVITATVQSFYTLDPLIHLIDRDIQHGAISYILFFSLLPISLMALDHFIPTPSDHPVETFGIGSRSTKVVILFLATCLLVSGAAWRAVTSFLPLRSPREPPWYFDKAAFWVFDVGVEVIVAYLYLLTRVDLRFHVPNGSKGPGDYSGESGHGVSSEIPLHGHASLSSESAWPGPSSMEKQLTRPPFLPLPSSIMRHAPVLSGEDEGRRDEIEDAGSESDASRTAVDDSDDDDVFYDFETFGKAGDC